MIGKRFFITLASILLFSTGGFAANSVKYIEQVTDGIVVDGDVDYTITSTEPFTTTGSVNITNTEHAAVIISKIKPSKVISSWLKNHVFINGVQAKNGTNCQVKMYGYGAIIFPYASDIKPLTVYSEQNYEGTSVNDFGLENTGGYMNTLTDAKLNNKIRSFKLKRGYMVTFSTRAKGRGYSRCFIADKEDLEVPTLPYILDKSITSYRVFQWYNAKKAGLASNASFAANDALNSSWCYDWAEGNASLSPDIEWVPNHIYEDYPSSATCGARTESCHMKTNNEPGNSADDRPQDVATVLANWENLMATGMRLCSESSHDGSMSHLKAFMDSIDARGWRCDILDLHCYWDTGSFNNLTWYSDYYGNGRPIWISEWVWGASWNRNGFWARTSTPGECSEANQQICYDGTVPILNLLNGHSRVERYAYWNSEAAGTHIYHDGALTKLGKYYANMGEGLGYNAGNEFIPKCPPQRSPSELSMDYNSETGKATLTWHEYNGEYNYSMIIQKRLSSAKPSAAWTDVQTVELKELEDDYYVEIDATEGYKYRVLIVDANGEERESNYAMPVRDSMKFGDAMEVNGETRYLGGNWLLNGDFEMGALDWTNGKFEAIATPYFQVVKTGGFDNTAYLQCLGSGGEYVSDYDNATAIRKEFLLKENGFYYVSMAGNNNGTGAASTQRITTGRSESSELNRRIEMSEATIWTKYSSAFKITTDTLMHLRLRNLHGTAQFDEVVISELFATQEEALADALEWEKKRANLFTQYNAKYANLNTEINSIADAAIDPNELEKSVKLMIHAYKVLEADDSIVPDAETVIAYRLPGYEDVQIALNQRKEAITAEEIVNSYVKLQEALDFAMPYNLNESLIKNGDFVSNTGWTTKAGTYTAGDQRLAEQAGKDCWNAWWSMSVAGNEDKTMEINQGSITIPSGTHGLFALECKATTQHLCENDQHSYFVNVNTGDMVESTALPYGLLDLPQIADDDKWVTLVTPYQYFGDKEVAKIGFVGSKKGCIDKQWIRVGNPESTGDNREGWWCATGFKLRHVPVYVKKTSKNGFGTICLPYKFTVKEGVKIYKLAGLLSDYSAVGIEEETDEIVAGRPYVFYAEPDSEVQFYESGPAVSSASTNYNGLRGVFINSGKYPQNGMYFNSDGVWNYIATAAERVTYANYDGFIRGISYIEVIDSWDGEKLPTTNMPDAPTAIKDVKSAQDSVEKSFETYDLSGKRANDNAKGIIIENGIKKVK